MLRANNAYHIEDDDMLDDDDDLDIDKLPHPLVYSFVTAAMLEADSRGKKAPMQIVLENEKEGDQEQAQDSQGIQGRLLHGFPLSSRHRALSTDQVRCLGHSWPRLRPYHAGTTPARSLCPSGI